MRVLLDSVGCRLNQSEIEHIGGKFLQAGHDLVGTPQECDLAVVNTCTVTAAAAADSRSATRRIHRANPSARIVLTGCWSTLSPEEALKLPGVARVIHNSDKEQLASHLLNASPEEFDIEPIQRGRLPGMRLRTRAFIKAQDGCDNFCTYCQTRIARGRARSLPLANVVHRVRAAHAGGAQEVVLTGVQLTSYGRDLDGGIDLTRLLRAILGETDVSRLRLSSLEPWGIPDGFIELWSDSRMCRQLHLPLQSGCAATLRRMRRPITPDRYARLVERARAAIPGLALTTDVIAGFPGETRGEFEESLAFLHEMDFAKVHLFTYSPRPGTLAADLPEPVDPKVAKERSQRIRTVSSQCEVGFMRRFIGEVLQVLWERAEALGPRGWRMGGVTDNGLRVSAITPTNMWNQLSPVRLTRLGPSGLLGEIASRP